MKKNIVNTLISGLSVLAAGTAQSFPNVGLVNTGEGIVVDNVTDFTYLLTNSSGNPIYGDYREAAIGSGWPISPWVADSNAPYWLTPTDNRTKSYDPSSNDIYKWTLNFNLTGYDSTTTSLEGRFSADNNAVALLNGVNIGSSTGFTSWDNFSASGNLFNAGANKREFIVTNFAQSEGNPKDVRVEIGSNVEPVPLLAAVWLFMLGLLGFLAVKRKSKSL